MWPNNWNNFPRDGVGRIEREGEEKRVGVKDIYREREWKRDIAKEKKRDEVKRKRKYNNKNHMSNTIVLFVPCLNSVVKQWKYLETYLNFINN